MDVTPAISTPQTAFFHGSYAEYLQSPTWRKRRNEKLRAGGYHCERCPRKRDLNVHHKNYQRLGCELDTDLEVLCRTCHESHHFQESAHEHIGLYLKIAADVIQDSARFSSDSDFMEAVKVRCARAHVPYNTEKLCRAVDIVIGKRPGIIAPRPIQEALNRGEAVAPPTKEEALNLLRQLNIRVGVREIPKAYPPNPRAVDRYKAAQMVAQEIQDSIARCEALEAKAEAS